MFSQLIKAQRRDNRSSARFPQSRPLTLEPLETRLTPATHVWSGAASTLWSNPANWSAGGSPAGDASADLVYPASGVTRFTSKDDLPVNSPIHSIHFDDRGYDLTATLGNQIQLGENITATNISGVNAIDLNISLAAANHTMTVANDGVLDIVRYLSGGAAGSNLVKDGAGELEFLGNGNDYKNATHVQAGTLRCAEGDSLGDYNVSALVVDGGATLVITESGEDVGSLSGSGSVVLEGGSAALGMGWDNTSAEFSGVISGNGSIRKIGTGTQTLSGHNTYTSVTNILGGTLRLGIDNALPSATFVGLPEGPSFRGTLDLANHNLTIEGLYQSLDSGPSFATVNLGTGTLTLHNDVDTVSVGYYGVISGTGGLVKEGTRSQKLGGDNTNFTGSTTINGGTLEVDGNQPQSAVTVAAGAVLRGTGTVGPAVTVFGTLRPGSLANPTGTLSVAGDVTFAGPSAIFAVEVDGTGAGQYSRLNATGTVDLGTGTTLTVTFGYAPSSGDTFPSVITCANRVNTFSVVPPGIQDSYSATGLDLSVL
jgi:autotransporter-associated beta strand protein